nr:hypothetical protein CFP56_70503 [Quercus suber]
MPPWSGSAKDINNHYRRVWTSTTHSIELVRVQNLLSSLTSRSASRSRRARVCSLGYFSDEARSLKWLGLGKGGPPAKMRWADGISDIEVCEVRGSQFLHMLT